MLILTAIMWLVYFAGAHLIVTAQTDKGFALGAQLLYISAQLGFFNLALLFCFGAAKLTTAIVLSSSLAVIGMVSSMKEG